ncbi:alpha-amylase family glycosyl hydrolase [Rubricoccus marinus]|uniref:Glycosyl hydrolase family 13 catalytic domain-containing protein n=1 Tax=Rubricoccus marinus TaxID=716817 RepID=A0A259TVL4_9BACT|nr:alpha-amylase family glycosyl hydrolase [Rubricoccus marinus]OZC01588.1 hypothetical protein BSZ36_00455 [Rubricoccus marinus]
MSTLFRLVLLLALASGASGALAQSVDVTFRFLPDLTAPALSPVVRAFVPGTMPEGTVNDWGPNNGGVIAPTAPSLMTYDAALNEYRYTISLTPGDGPVAGGGHAYKIHYHRNASGTEYTWITDPLGSETTGGNNDSVVRVSDPMAFQLAREQDASGQIVAVSVGLFGTEAFPSISFTVNETTYTSGIEDTGDGIYRLELPTPVPPGSFFRVDAADASGDAVSAQVGTLPPDVVDAPVPAGIEDGITHSDAGDGTTWLVLRAPAKSYVYALGDFNDWTVGDDALMFRDTTDPRGTRWWIRLDGLTLGEAYDFQYLVDGTIRVADPYSPIVLYPGEAGYPSGQTDFAVGRFTAGGSAFAWTDDDFEAPTQEDLVIYELLVRDFLRDHSFVSLTDTLDYLQRLGVNAIELMPVAEFDGDESWGYNPAFHLALDKYYGTPEQFKTFVNEAHARGIAVFLDVVYNHATGQSPLIRLYNSGGFSGPSASSPYANVTATHPFNVFNDLNHESELTQIWLDKANRWWVEEYHVDGYRFDLTAGFMQTGDFYNYNPGRIALLTRMMDALWDEHPETTVILEHLINSAQEWRDLALFQQDEGRPGAMLWHKMDREYAQSAMGYPTATDFPSTLEETYPPRWVGGQVPLANAVTYMESHDEQWTMWRNRNFGNASGAYNIRDLHTALDRQKLVGAFFLTVPGPRMIWQFGELGYGYGPGECLVNGTYPGECAPGTPDRVNDKPIRWDYWEEGVSPFGGSFQGALTPATDRERELRQKLYGTWAALLGLRADYAIFSDPETEFRAELGRTASRWITLSLPTAPEGEPTEVVIVGNFGVTNAFVAPEWPSTGTWYDFFADTEQEVAFPQFTQELLPGEFRVYTNVDVPSPDPGLITVANEDTEPLAPEAFGLRAFPNPASGALGVDVMVQDAGDLTVELFDVLGRRVATLHEGAAPAGRQRLDVDVSGVPAGVYVVRAASGGTAATARITVAR